MRSKRNNYLMDNSDENKKSKRQKKRAIKGIVKFEDYRNCLGTT